MPSNNFTNQNKGREPHFGSPSVLTKLTAKTKSAAARLKYSISVYLLNNPRAARVGFAIARRIRPIFCIGTTFIAVRDCDVQNLLHRDEDLLVGKFMNPRMVCGPFILGIDWREQHTSERTALENARHKSADQRIIRDYAVNSAQRLINDATNGAVHGRAHLDIARGFSEIVAIEVLTRYLGLNIPTDAKARDELRNISTAILDLPPEGSVQADQLFRSATTISEQVELEIKRIFSEANLKGSVQGGPSNSFISRLAQGSLATLSAGEAGEECARRSILGLLTAGVATVARATTHAFDQLLARPHEFALAQETARALSARMQKVPNRCAQDVDDEVIKLRNALSGYIDEALRFRPTFPFLVRFAPRRTIIGTQEEDRRCVRGGSTVIAAPLAAMFDPTVFKCPAEFRTDRGSTSYLHFGTGRHACFGRYIAETEIFEMIRELLLLKDLRRESRLRHEGPTVKELKVSFDAGSFSQGVEP